jgi:hypothetical protein
MTLKSNDQNQLMMIVVVHPQSLDQVMALMTSIAHRSSNIFQNGIDQLKKDLLKYFVDGAGRECHIDSIYFQTW